jgi:glucose/arabinose dehydrogenase
MLRVAAVGVSLVMALGACLATTPSQTPVASSTPLPVPSPSTAAVSTAGATTTASPVPAFDPAHVSVSVQPYAHVSGGPLAIVAPQDGSGRLFVATQAGRIWAVKDSVTTKLPMLDISGRITSGGERGLLGIALHPGFPTDPRIYADYTDTNGNTVVSSFTLAPGSASSFDPGSERIIFRATQPFPNHNGGALLFGPDGDLYISLGDGGSEGDPLGTGQRRDTPLGKILRIDVDRSAGGRAYAIPTGNPFAGDPLSRPEIWLYGLRNPWRMSFDSVTGDLWIGDVGQDRWEEVDVVRAGVGGLNLGWSRMEGSHCYQPSTGCDQSGLTLPITEYGHDQGCAIIGGYVYRGSAFPILRGGYVFSDDCSGNVWAIPASATAPTKPVLVGKVDSGISAFGEDAAGELYVTNLDGTISKVTAASR